MSQRLLSETHRFDFFQAVRLLQRTASRRFQADPARQRRPVGYDHAPQEEVVRFRAMPSLSFPSAPISEIRAAREDASGQAAPFPPEMTVTFMGLTGPNGVLPRHYSALLIERIRSKDYTLRDFLDLFNHRAVSLFYRAWEKYRFAIGYERFQLTAEGPQDPFTQCLYCLLGLGTGGLRGRVEFDDEAFLFYAGYLAHRPRSAVCLELMLADYFALPVQVRQFLGQWLYLSPDDQSRLPSAEHPRGLNSRLGVDVVIGQRVWDVESKFRIRVGPLSYREFLRLVPSADAFGQLCQMVRCYVGAQFDFDVQLVLQAAEVPWLRVGGDDPNAARLGWNTWLRSRPLAHDVADAVFSPRG